ncbi:MAG: alanine racemase [Gammaproteobacteria bacterium]|nr:alanine racemase [Gammaproteobacteria bacterium]
MIKQAYMELSAKALLHNVNIVKQHAKGSRIIAMLKADAYGHGLLPIANILKENHCVDIIGVARLEEALSLREAQIDIPLLVFQGAFEADDFIIAAQQNIQLIIHSAWQIDILEKTHLPNPIFLWLKVNTGMNRLGLRPEEAPHAWQRLIECRQVAKPLRCMTHFANANAGDHKKTEEQLNTFREMIAHFDNQGEPIECSLAKSAAILHSPDTHQDWVRPGMMLYGASPVDGTTAPNYHLQPVMTLRTVLMAIQDCDAGETIGYDGTWRCPEATRVGIVAFGYGDGYPRHVPNGTPVLVNGKRVPLIGRVSMDMIAVDLRTQPEAQIGSPVVLWGEGLSAEEIAKFANTTAYELFCQVTPRVKRVVV